jgi:hypothetical protein
MHLRCLKAIKRIFLNPWHNPQEPSTDRDGKLTEEPVPHGQHKMSIETENSP